MKPRLACITVTYHPDIAVLRRQMLRLPDDALKVLVDNASGDAARNALRGLAQDIPRCHLLELEANIGLAGGINAGAREANRQQPGSLFLLLDQDSEPEPGAVDRLISAYCALSAETAELGCVGPRLVDASTGLDHGFHVLARWGWPRAYLSAGAPVAVANINGSGTLVHSALFESLGGLRTDFFIDHVDTEWAFRVTAAGYRLYGVPDSEFVHRMGDRGVPFWFFGWRVWPHRSPARHYHLFRNSVVLMRSSNVPLRWKLLAPVKLLVTLVVHAISDPERGAQVRQMMRGLAAGVRIAGGSKAS